MPRERTRATLFHFTDCSSELMLFEWNLRTTFRLFDRTVRFLFVRCSIFHFLIETLIFVQRVSDEKTNWFINYLLYENCIQKQILSIFYSFKRTDKKLEISFIRYSKILFRYKFRPFLILSRENKKEKKWEISLNR